MENPAFHDDIEVFTSIDLAAIDSDSNGDTKSLAGLQANGLDRTAVTKGNRIVFGSEATGIWGALFHFSTARDAGPLGAGQTVDHRVLRDFLTAEDGVSLRVRQTNPGINEPASRLNLSRADPEDVTLFLADATELETPDAPGRFYLVIDTSNDNAIGNQLDPGDEYRVTFELLGERDERYRFSDRPDGPFDAASVDDDTVPEQFPYFAADEAGVSVETSFSVADRYLRYDHTTDEGTVLADSGEITGETTLLPATEPSVAFSYDDGETTRVSESTVTIDDGGNFSVDVGLPGVPDGDRVLLTLRDDTRLHDSRTVIVATDAADPHRLRLTNTTTNLTVRRGESLAAFSTTIRNVGAVTDSQQLSLDIAGGAIVADRDVTVSPDTPQNETFGGVDVDLEPGQYPYTLAIDDDRINGSMTVETNPAVTRIDPDGNVTSAEAGSDGNAASAEAGSDGNRSVSGSDSATDRSTADDSANGTERNETDGAGGTDSADAAEAGTDAAGGAGGDTPSKTPPEGGAGAVLPIGVGTREVLGGTALVGVVHLLGHWV